MRINNVNLTANVQEVPAHERLALYALGSTDEDILLGLETQQQQRQFGAPVLPLRAILGHEPRFDLPAKSKSKTILQSTGDLFDKLNRRFRHKPYRPVPKMGGLHLTGQPVRAGSIHAGSDDEAQFHQLITDKQRRKILGIYMRLADHTYSLRMIYRTKSRELTDDELRILHFNNNCVNIMRFMLDGICYRKGSFFPTYQTIAEAIRLSRRQTGDYLAALSAMGLLDWRRRFNYTHDEQKGARSTQTSNIFWTLVPDFVLKLLGIAMPIPDDERTRQEQRFEQDAVMYGSLSDFQRARTMPQSGEYHAELLAAALRLDMRAANSQECNFLSEPHKDLYIIGQKGVCLVGKRTL